MITNLKEKMIDINYKIAVKRLLMQEKIQDGRKKIKDLWGDNRGIAVIEVILILVVVMALGVVFRKKIKALFDSIFNEIDSSGKKIIKGFQ